MPADVITNSNNNNNPAPEASQPTGATNPRLSTSESLAQALSSVLGEPKERDTTSAEVETTTTTTNQALGKDKPIETVAGGGEAPKAGEGVAPQTGAGTQPPTEGETTEARLTRLTDENVRLLAEQESIRQQQQAIQNDQAYKQGRYEFEQERAEPRQVIRDLQEDWKEADANYKAALQQGDTESALVYDNLRTKLDNRINPLIRAERAAEGRFKQWSDGLGQHQHAQRLNQHERSVDAELKKFGLSLAELRTANPKLDITNPYEVIAGASKAQQAKLELERKKLAEEKKVFEQKTRKQWEDTSPGSRPFNPGASGVGAGRPATGAGKTNELLNWGLQAEAKR